MLVAIYPYPTLSETVSTQQPFGFLKQLAGCHKGETVKGLHEAKQYLKKFGYLDAGSMHENDDEFDDVLESAIKTYQLNYNLETSGILDASTIEQMMMPRCGMPDIDKDGTTSMKSGMKHHHHHDHLNGSLHIVSHYTFLPGNPKWQKLELVDRFRSSAAANVNASTLRSACVRALSSWAAVSKFKFRVPASTQESNDILMGFHRGDHGDGAPFDGPLGVLGHSFPPQIGGLHLDADENWLGHVLGLGHSSDTNAVMFSGLRGGQRKRKPKADDINGMRALYG
ncbi:hypothetical protein MKX03_010422 [Papaver bracteatum]|nr:hypothetical protein MKX03_010422 [Papaver bracteatum]